MERGYTVLQTLGFTLIQIIVEFFGYRFAL